MALYGVSFTLNYVAWDTANNVGKAGDASNHTLKWIKDGTVTTPANTPIEVDATNAPGVYKLTLTAGEAQATYGTLAGKSSSANVVIMPVSVAFERLPNVDPGSAGGLPVLNANARVDADAVSLSSSAANAVWQSTTRTLTSAMNITSDSQPIDQNKLANLDAAISSRLAASAYVAPDNASIAAIKSKTDNLQFDSSNRVIADAQAISASTAAADAVEANISNLDTAVSSRLASSAYVPPPSSSTIAAAVWDEGRSGHNATGTYGAVSEWASALTAAGVWSYATRTLTSAVSITSDGSPIDQAKVANLDAAISSRLGQSDIATIVTNVFANTIENGITFKNLCQVLGAVIAGCISTAGTDTEVFKAINNSGITRVTVSVDEHGNRSNVVFTL